MAQLGYTWYPQNWWTSETYKRLKRFPLVRYALRELIDLMYKEGHPIEMNKEYLIDDFDIELTDIEYKKLLEYVIIMEDGKWWLSSVKKRISKAESARQNGKKGGAKKGNQNAKKTTQQPKKTTQENNPNNPSLERESKRESKREEENKDNDNNNNEYSSSSLFSIEDLSIDYLKNDKVLNAVINNKENKFKDLLHLKEKLEVFKSELKQNGITTKTKTDFATHFRNWNKKNEQTFQQPIIGKSNQIRK